MAFVALTADVQQKILAQRPGPYPSGTAGTALVSDLVSGDFLWGMRATVISTGSTTSGVRTLTVERLGAQFTANLVAASSLWIVRP